MDQLPRALMSESRNEEEGGAGEEASVARREPNSENCDVHVKESATWLNGSIKGCETCEKPYSMFS
jgi:hypothetical protein